MKNEKNRDHGKNKFPNGLLFQVCNLYLPGQVHIENSKDAKEYMYILFTTGVQ